MSMVAGNNLQNDECILMERKNQGYVEGIFTWAVKPNSCPPMTAQTFSSGGPYIEWFSDIWHIMLCIPRPDYTCLSFPYSIKEI